MVDGFLGIGFWEILLIFVIILALLGPRRLPEIAGRLGALFRQLKKASSDLTTALTKEVEGTPLKKDENPLDSLKKAAIDLKSSLTKEVGDAAHKENDSPRGEIEEPRIQE
jgi:sec-independent protein translocase protein TatB